MHLTLQLISRCNTTCPTVPPCTKAVADSDVQAHRLIAYQIHIPHVPPGKPARFVFLVQCLQVLRSGLNDRDRDRDARHFVVQSAVISHGSRSSTSASFPDEEVGRRRRIVAGASHLRCRQPSPCKKRTYRKQIYRSVGASKEGGRRMAPSSSDSEATLLHVKNVSDRSWTHRRLRRLCSASVGRPGWVRPFLTLLKRNHVPELDTARGYNGSECGESWGRIRSPAPLLDYHQSAWPHSKLTQL